MKIWTLRFLAGAAALFVTAAPVAVDQGSEIVESAIPTAAPVLPCEGGKFGCWPKTGGTCVIRYGKSCEKIKLKDDQCNADLPACVASFAPGSGGQT